jgi:hypothetical protein
MFRKFENNQYINEQPSPFPFKYFEIHPGIKSQLIHHIKICQMGKMVST